MDNKNIFATNLNYYMNESGKSRQDVSKALGVSYYTISDWCNGKKYPRMDKVEMLANYFDILKSDLIEDKKEKPTIPEDDGLTENQRILMEFARNIPDDKAALALKIIRSIVESD